MSCAATRLICSSNHRGAALPIAQDLNAELELRPFDNQISIAQEGMNVASSCWAMGIGISSGIIRGS